MIFDKINGRKKNHDKESYKEGSKDISKDIDCRGYFNWYNLRMFKRCILRMCLVLAAVIGLSICGPKSMAMTASAEAYTAQFWQTEARTQLKMVNDFRTSKEAWYWNSDNSSKTVCKNLGTLKWDYNLEKAAMQRAAELVFSFSHTRPDGTMCYTVIDDFNIDYYSYGENIAYGYSSSKSVFNGWKEDNEAYNGQGHRRNMLNSGYNAIGIACIRVGYVCYWAMELGYTGDHGTATAASDKEVTISRSSKGKVTIKEAGGGSSDTESSLDTPQLKSLTTANGKVKVTWKKVENASGYYVYRNKQLVGTVCGSDAISFLDETVVNGASYTYYVVAYQDLDGGSGKLLSSASKSKKLIYLSASTVKSFKNNASKKLTVKWSKNSKATGYEVELSQSKSFAANKTQTVTVKGSSKTSTVFTKLSKKTYYVRIRAYKTSGKNTYYSAWSARKSCKVKK